MEQITNFNPQDSNNPSDLFNIKPQQEKKPINKKYIILGISAAVLIFGSLLTLYILSNQSSDVLSPFGDDSGGKVDAKLNPLTGETWAVEETENSVDERPLGAMINNHVDARPQSGLIYADVVYEMVAEGGITRYIAFFLGDTPEKIGPVRSTREYYLVLVKELGDAMLMHIGWSPQALEAIELWPVRSLGRGGGEFWRDNPRNVATEHTAYTNGAELRKVAYNLGWDGVREFDMWKFKEDKAGYTDAPIANNITIDFWYKGDYSGIFKYNPENNSYLRFTGYDMEGNPMPLFDQEETDKQVQAKNLIVQFATETAIAGDDKNRLEYELVGSGQALVFVDGKVIKATWSKPDRDGRTKYYDLNGQEIEFNRGNFWISIVPDRNEEQVVFE